MAFVAIQFVFSGLIAFVPNSFQDPSIMTAYIVKSSNHNPELSILVSEVDTCAAGPCKVDNPKTPIKCVCELRAVEEILLEPPAVTGVRYLRPEAPGVLPTRARATDLAWLVRMRNVESAAARIASFESIKPYIWTRMSFGWDYARNCAFDEVEEDSQFRVRPMDFVGASQQKSDLRQAVSEEIGFEARVPAGPVKLILRHRASSGRLEEVELKLRCGDGTCPDLVISNEAPKSCDSCDVGHHFDDYYKLARNKASLERFLPHRNYQSYADSAGLDLTRCRPRSFDAVSNRVICPMALYEP
jgi:hypothetical protein